MVNIQIFNDHEGGLLPRLAVLLDKGGRLGWLGIHNGHGCNENIMGLLYSRVGSGSSWEVFLGVSRKEPSFSGWTSRTLRSRLWNLITVWGLSNAGRPTFPWFTTHRSWRITMGTTTVWQAHTHTPFCWSSSYIYLHDLPIKCLLNILIRWLSFLYRIVWLASSLLVNIFPQDIPIKWDGNAT